MKKNKTIPEWLKKQENCTSRQWKSRKRSELKSVIDAFSKYKFGCAHTPDGLGEVYQIQSLLDQLCEKLSIKNWGR